MLDRCLEHFKILPNDLNRLPKSDPRKMLIAGLLRYHFPVSAFWISQSLSMGHYTTVSRAMHFFDTPEPPWDSEKNKILKFTGWPLFKYYIHSNILTPVARTGYMTLNQ